MANLKVKIVIRTTSPDGKRGWVNATGKNDPVGSLYLRYCKGSKPRYEKVSDIYDDAEIAKMRLERKLRAASMGITLPEEAQANTTKLHRCLDCLDSYLNFLRTTTKRNGRRYNERSTLAREANIRQFIRFINKPYVEQLNRADMLRYKEQLYSEGKANDTVGNKLLTVTSWLKHNQTVSITGLLLPADWPLKRKTKPQPFREAEIKAMMECATPAERLLLRLALGTGMRKGELSHAERSDIDQFSQCIRIKDKPRFGWETKTLASVREIPLGDDLLCDLLALPAGLLFGNTEGQPDDHIDRIFEAVGTRAEVQPPVDDKASWCHRWRDTFATQQVKARKLQLRDIARIMGHEDLKTMDLYAEFVRMDSTEAREAANAVDVHGAGPRLVKRA